MNITQIFSGASLKANLDEYLLRHDLTKDPPCKSDGLQKQEVDIIKHSICTCIKNILMNYSQEMYDYFRFEIDHLVNKIYEENAPRSRKRKRLMSYMNQPCERPRKKKVCLRSRTGYLMFCQHLRETVLNYRAMKPQRLWNDLTPEEKHEWVLKGKQSQPMKWSNKTKFKSSYGKQNFEPMTGTEETKEESQSESVYSDTSEDTTSSDSSGSRSEETSSEDEMISDGPICIRNNVT